MLSSSFSYQKRIGYPQQQQHQHQKQKSQLKYHVKKNTHVLKKVNGKVLSMTNNVSVSVSYILFLPTLFLLLLLLPPHHHGTTSSNYNDDSCTFFAFQLFANAFTYNNNAAFLTVQNSYNSIHHHTARNPIKHNNKHRLQKPRRSIYLNTIQQTTKLNAFRTSSNNNNNDDDADNNNNEQDHHGHHNHNHHNKPNNYSITIDKDSIINLPHNENLSFIRSLYIQGKFIGNIQCIRQETTTTTTTRYPQQNDDNNNDDEKCMTTILHIGQNGILVSKNNAIDCINDVFVEGTLIAGNLSCDRLIMTRNGVLIGNVNAKSM